MTAFGDLFALLHTLFLQDRDTQFGFDVLVAVALSLVAIGVVDAVARLAIGAKYTGSLRWFLLHAAANLGVVILAMPAMVLWVVDPVQMGVRGPAGVSMWTWEGIWSVHSDWPVCLIVAIHTYHVLFFKLTFDELWHHFLFVPCVGIYGGLCQLDSNVGCRNVTAFFMSGLPGGISYVNLVLVKLGLMDKLREKHINSWINQWIRGPGLLLIAATEYALLLYVRRDVPIYVAVIIMGLTVYNGVHYMGEAIENAAVRETEARVRAEKPKKA